MSQLYNFTKLNLGTFGISKTNVMKFTVKDFLIAFAYILIFQVVALIAWHFFEYKIFAPMAAASMVSYIAGRRTKKVQKQ